MDELPVDQTALLWDIWYSPSNEVSPTVHQIRASAELERKWLVRKSGTTGRLRLTPRGLAAIGKTEVS